MKPKKNELELNNKQTSKAENKGNSKESTKENVLDLIWDEYIEGHEYFLTQNNEVCVKMPIGGDVEGYNYILVNSEEFKDQIKNRAYRERKYRLKNDSLRQLIEMIEVKARIDNMRILSFVRIGKTEEDFYYDLGGNGKVRIGENGYEVVNDANICFIKKATALDQCKPIENKDIDVWDLKPFINVKTDEAFILFLVNLISHFVPNIPHQILILNGNQGSSKSTVSRIIKKIIDPSTVDIYSFPTNKEDLVLHLNSAYLVIYDNLGRIKPEFNDILCQVATGGKFLKRKLFTDSDLVTFSLKKGLVLNGINLATDQPDLLDRSIVLNLKTINSKDRKTEMDIFDEIDEIIPYILHDIFEIVSNAKKIYEDIELKELPRMADAVKWSCSIAEAMGVGADEYMRIYNSNQKNINIEVLSSNLVGTIIIDFMDIRDSWIGPVSDLWEILNGKAFINGVSKDKSWAKTPSQLSRNLNMLKTNLEKIGIFYEIRNVGTHKEIEIWNKNVKPKTNIKSKPKSKSKSKVTSKKSIKKRVSKSDLDDLD